MEEPWAQDPPANLPMPQGAAGPAPWEDDDLVDAGPSWGERVFKFMKGAAASVSDRAGTAGDYGMPGVPGFVDPIGQGEDARRALGRLPGTTVVSFKSQSVQMMAGVEQAYHDRMAVIARRQAKDFAAKGQFARAATALAMASAAEERSKAVAGTAKEARKAGEEAVPADEGALERGVRSGLSSAAVTLPAIVAGGPVAGATALGIGAGGARYSQLRDAGVPEDAAARSAVLLGSLETLTEFLPGAKLVDKAPIAKRFLEFMVRELPGENVTSLAQIADDYANQLQDDVTLDDVVAAVRDTSLAASFGGSAQVGIAHGIASVTEAANARAATRTARAPWLQDDRAEPAPVEQPQPPVAGEAPPVVAVPEPEPPPVPQVAAVPPVAGASNVPPASPEPVAAVPPPSPQPSPSEEPAGTPAIDVAAPWEADVPLTPDGFQSPPRSPLERLAADEGLRNDLASMKNEIGWAERGGRMIRSGVDEQGGLLGSGGGEVIGRTKWIPKAEWWPGRPKGLKDEQVAIERRANVPFLPELPEVEDVDLPADAHSANEIALVARATEINEAAVERLAIQHADNDDAFLKAIKELVDGAGQNSKTSEGGQDGGGAPQAAMVRGGKGQGDIFGGSDRTAVNEKNAAVDRNLGKGRAPIAADQAPPGDMFADAARRKADKTEGKQVDIEAGGPDDTGIKRSVQKAWDPGAAYVETYQGGAPLPAGSAGTIALGRGTNDERQVNIPKEPIRREHVMDLFQRLFDVKVYQGKPFKVKKAAGFFRPKTFEVRVRKKNDLEVTAHEVFHWLDRTYPTLRKLYHLRRYAAELKGVSYDKGDIAEGFAEFGRLYLTNEVEALGRAPQFYTDFVTETKDLGIYAKLAKVQEQMHQWYYQGAEARAASKIGEADAPIRQRLDIATDRWSDRAIANALDHVHAAKVIERTLHGNVAADAATSPYKSIRLLAGARSTANSFLNFGTAEWNDNGELVFNGKGLRQIFEPVGNDMEPTMLYFVGRRAKELSGYGKENLFSQDEIAAMLAIGMEHPRGPAIRKAFEEYQQYTDRLLHFARQSGLISADTIALWKAMYRNYVPFYRVPEAVGGSNVTAQHTALPSPSAVFKRLKGGSQNLRDIWENIAYNTAVIVHASLKNRAKQQLYRMIEKNPLGQRYAVRVPTADEAVKVEMTQVESTLRKLKAEAKTNADKYANDKTPNGIANRIHYLQVAAALDMLTQSQGATGEGALAAMQGQATFFTHGHAPTIADRDSILVNGKRVWFQLGDPMLMDMASEINAFKPLGLMEKILGLGKRVLTRGVVITPEFQLANIFRDSVNAATMSLGGQKPIISALAAMRDIWTESPAYKSYLLNGGGFGNAITDEAKSVKVRVHRLDRHHLLDMPSKILDFYDKWGQSFELATRLAEYKKIRDKGGTAREGAFQGREVSSDFAVHGKATLTRWLITSLPFFGARLQGLYRIERELFERGGRQSWTGERMLTYASRSLLSLTLPTLLLYALNRDDDDWKQIPEEIKNLYWLIKLPDGQGWIRLPKPFETGALFATVPERIWQYMEEHNPRKLTDAALFTLANTFAFGSNPKIPWLPIPQAVKPPLDIALNTAWTGAPIVPEGLQKVEPAEQYRPWTPATLVAIGKMFDVSPLKLEALLNGYLGTVGQWTTMAADTLVTAPATGERPEKRASQYPVIRRFFMQQPFTSTSYEKRYYEILNDAERTAATFRKMRKEARGDDIAEYLGVAEREQLFAIAGAIGKVNERVTGIESTMRRIQSDPSLSAAAKRRELEELQGQENELFREVVEALDAPALAKYRDALEGKQP